jgi:hypothetical protein
MPSYAKRMRRRRPRSIDEDQIEGMPGKGLYSLPSVIGNRHGVPVMGQHANGDLLVESIFFG